MSHKSEIIGIIGGGSMKPTMTRQWKQRGQQMKAVDFTRFSMFVEDMTKRAEFNQDTGRKERPREVIQVILPEDERGSNLFKYLSPGRRVMVEGNLTHRAAVGTNRKGEKLIYANLKLYSRKLTFLGSPRDQEVERNINLLHEIKAVSEEEMVRLQTAAKEHFEKMALEDPPREFIDETAGISKPDAEKAKATVEAGDPDKPDF